MKAGLGLGVLPGVSRVRNIGCAATNNLSGIHPQTLAVECRADFSLWTSGMWTNLCRKLQGKSRSARRCGHVAEPSPENLPQLFDSCRGPNWRCFGAPEFRSGHRHSPEHHRHQVGEKTWIRDDEFNHDCVRQDYIDAIRDLGAPIEPGVKLARGLPKSTEVRIAAAASCAARLSRETRVLLLPRQKSQEPLPFPPKNVPAAYESLVLSEYLAAASR